MTAAVQAQAPGPDAARLAAEDADRAMAWLTRAVAAGFTDAARMKADADLGPLRGRADFQKLSAEVEAKAKAKAKAAAKRDE